MANAADLFEGGDFLTKLLTTRGHEFHRLVQAAGRFTFPHFPEAATPQEFNEVVAREWFGTRVLVGCLPSLNRHHLRVPFVAADSYQPMATLEQDWTESRFENREWAALTL